MRFMKKSQRAFTLLELIVAIVIVALLAGLAIPTFMRVQEKGQDNVAAASLASVLRNATSLTAFEKTQVITLEMLQTAASETSLAAATGTYAEASVFSVVEDPLPSTKYGELSVALSDGVVGVATLSPTGSCILGRADGVSSPQTWIYEGEATECRGLLGLDGPGAEPELPGEENPDVFGIPQNLEANAENARVSLSWDAVATATGYRIYRDGVSLIGTVSNSYIDRSAINGVTYRYTVQAYNNEEESLQSESAYATPNPPVVETVADLSVATEPTTDLAGSATGEALVTWSPVAGATAYQVYLDDLLSKVVTFDAANPASASELMLNKLIISQTYDVSVKAVNTRGTGAEARTAFSVEPSEAAPDVMPIAPIDVTALAGNASALVSWKSVSEARSYRVYVDGIFAAQTKNVASTLKGLTNGKIHSVTVSSVNFAGESSQSASAEFVPYEHLPEVSNPLDPESGLPALPLGAKALASSVVLSWSSVTGATTYEITRDGVVISNASSIGFIDLGFTPGAVHSYKVVAKNAAAAIASGSKLVETLPASPLNLNAVGIDKGAQLSWTPTNGAVSYRIYVDGTLATQTQKTSGIISGLTNAQVHQVSVSAVNAAGESARTSAVNVTPLAGVTLPPDALNIPNTPSSFNAKLQTSAVELSWEASAGAEGYRIYRDQTLLTQVSGIEYADVDLLANGSYDYQVSAFNSAGESARTIIIKVSTNGLVTSDGSIELPPLTPVNLKATPGNKSALLSWNASTGAGAYRVYLDGSLFGQVSSLTNLNLKDLNNGQVYSATVVAINKGGSSAHSSPVIFTPVAKDGEVVISIPNAPTNLSVIGQDRSFSASWNASLSATGYQVYYRDLNVENAPLILVAQSATPNFSVSAPAGAHWSFSVKAFNLSGSSAATSGSAFTIPPAPESLKISALSSTSAKLNWNPAPGAVDYRISGGPSALSSGSTSLQLEGLAPNTTYNLSVSARNMSGSSGESGALGLTTLTAVPTSLTGVDGNAQVTLSWNATPGATMHRLYRDGVLIATTSNLSFIDLNRTNGLVHAYSLSSVSARGESAKSTALSIGAVDPIFKLVPVTPSVNVSTSGSKATVSWALIPNALSYSVYVNDIFFKMVTTSSVEFEGPSGGSSSVRVEATNKAGTSSRSNALTALFAPSAPGGLTALYDSSAIALSWNASTGATIYRVYRSDLAEPVYQGAVKSFTDTAIDTSKTYSYTVTAGNAGGWSSPSPSVTASLVPAAPTLSATITPTAAVLSWNKSALATSYQIYRNGVQVNTVTSLTFSDFNAVTAQAYSYHVIAVNTAGESVPSNTVISGRAPAAPPAPAVGVRDRGLNVLVNPVSGINTYKIYVDGVFVGTASSSNLSILVDGLTNGQTYQVTTTWYTANGLESAQSPARSGLPQGAPNVPTSFIATPVAEQINLSWAPMVASLAQPLTGFRIYRDGTLIQTVNASTTAFTDIPGDNLSHVYGVVAYGTMASAMASAEPVTAAVGLVTNGGFEAGISGWTSVGTTVVNSSWGSRSGLRSAMVGSPTNTGANTSSLSQTFTVPAEGATLNFDYLAYTSYSTSQARVFVRDNFSGKLTYIPIVYNPATRNATYLLESQAGHSVTLTFEVYRQYVSDPAYLHVDNVKISRS